MKNFYEIPPGQVLEKKPEMADFSKCQLNKIIEAVKAGRQMEFESVSPYLADYNSKTGEVWKDKLTKADKTGIEIANVLKEEFPESRMISLYDEYNSNLSDSSDERGRPVPQGQQLEYPEEVKINFKNSIEGLLKDEGIIKEGDQEGKEYLFVSESSKIKEAEELVKRLEAQGNIVRNEKEILFKNNENEIPLRTKGGRWLCEALDASSYLKPENLEITHLVVLPNSFKEQQDKVWEILQSLGIKPDNYHNIFFDDKDENLKPDQIAGYIKEQIETAKQASKN